MHPDSIAISVEKGTVSLNGIMRNVQHMAMQRLQGMEPFSENCCLFKRIQKIWKGTPKSEKRQSSTSTRPYMHEEGADGTN